MKDMDSPLTLNGTVYSEMTGVRTLSWCAMLNSNSTAFPGSVLGFDQGGNPEAIPDMTWESLKEFHHLFYHPSNCLAILYGHYEDYTAFLRLLNEVFSSYEKQEFSFADSAYTRITEPVTASFPYGVAEGTDTDHQSVVYYQIVCPGLREDKAAQLVVDHAFTLLYADSSLLMQNLKKALPSASFSCYRETAAPDDAAVFIAYNVNPEDAETFRAVVNDSLKQIAADGFDPVQLDAILARQMVNDKLAMETDNAFTDLFYYFTYGYATTGDPMGYTESVEARPHMREESESGTLASAIDTWLVDPALYALTTTYPEPGLKEKQDAALAEKLAEIKAGMTEEEKQAIIDATNAEPEERDNTEAVASLTAVTVKDLPEEIRHYQITDEVGEDGVRRMNAVAGVDGIGRATIYLDARTLPQEDIHYFRLFTRLLGQMDTDAHTGEELAVLMDRYLMKRSIGMTYSDTPEKDDMRVYLRARWTALDEDLPAGYELMKEVLFHTQFTDVEMLSGLITAEKTSVRNTINKNPYVALDNRQEGIGDPNCRYYDYITYIPYYEFLADLEKQMDSDPKTVVAHLQSVQSFLADRCGAVSTFAGNEASIVLNAPLVDAFFADMASEARDYPVYDLPEPAMREAIAVDTGIQYNCIAASFSQIGAEPDYAFKIIGTLIRDKVLIPILRDQMGAYGVYSGMDGDYALYLISARDPNVQATFDLYDSIPERLRNMELTQDQIDGYIMNAYSDLAKPEGELTGAVTAMADILEGMPILPWLSPKGN